MKTCFAAIILLLGLSLAARADTDENQTVRSVTLESESVISFTTDSYTYQLNLSAWGADLFDKAHALLVTAQLSGKKVDVGHLQDRSKVDVIQINATPAGSQCDLVNGNTNIVTSLTGIALNRYRPDSYELYTLCSATQALIAQQAEVGASNWQRMFYQHLASLARDRRVWLGCAGPSSVFVKQAATF
jgi:hypothetical protein